MQEKVPAKKTRVAKAKPVPKAPAKTAAPPATVKQEPKYSVEIEKPAKKAGAASKRTPERRAAILDCLELGMSLEASAKYAGIHFDTLNEWRKVDPEFTKDIQSARNTMEHDMLDRIREAAKDAKNWTAAAWKLERIVPEKYARKFQPLAMAQEMPQGDAPGKVYKVSIAPVEGDA